MIILYYINLKHRTDRLELFRKQIKDYKLGEYIKIIRYEGDYIPSFPELGCSNSHLAVIKHAMKNSKEDDHIIICEDDLEILVSPEEFKEFILTAITIDFDVLCIGHNRFVTQISENKEKETQNIIVNASNIQTASCYMIKQKYLDTLFQNVSEATELLEKTKMTRVYVNDQYWKKLQKNWYVPVRNIVRQRAGFSDIVKKEMAYDT